MCLCEIEQTERGWYITSIDKDPDAVKREVETERKEKKWILMMNNEDKS